MASRPMTDLQKRMAEARRELTGLGHPADRP
jgi:hypothetical protein